MGKCFPRIYDFAMAPLERKKLKGFRKNLIANAEGRVLEIGSGTGVNFGFYLPIRTKYVDAIEPNPDMKERSVKRIEAASVPIQVHLVGAEKLPFPDNTFDSVVATLVFCTIPDPEQALREIQRVSKPGSSILLFEHVRMNDSPFLAKIQEKLTPLWKKVCDGCHLNRNTKELILQSGLKVTHVNTYYKGLFVTMNCTNSKRR
ncbi:class I SAM-dependent methyltransferase [Aquibacillus kalidii]|uniref:class I SAM-dependent methyltransferase n=1 Tax=Aquibacillus kalidii TaxID=2762597 RepID=UPI00164928A6|nr:class I SAM-dependent methyltransferase [Aquibacillus kalidii]